MSKNSPSIVPSQRVPTRKFPARLPVPDDENTKLYTGGCHCGAVSVAVKIHPLPEVEIKEDNCSICQRKANICLYPDRSQVTVLGEERMAEYCFGRNFTAHRFCSVCGVHVDMKLYGPPEEVVDSVPEAKQKLVRRNLAIEPVRVAVLDDIEWTDINIRRSDEGTGGYVFDS